MQSSVYSKLTILKGNFTFSESSELYIEIQLGVILNLVWKLHSYVGYTIFLWFRTSWWYPLFVTFFSECMLFMSWDELSFVYIEFHRIFECHQSFFFFSFFFFENLKLNHIFRHGQYFMDEYHFENFFYEFNIDSTIFNMIMWHDDIMISTRTYFRLENLQRQSKVYAKARLRICESLAAKVSGIINGKWNSGPLEVLVWNCILPTHAVHAHVFLPLFSLIFSLSL